MNLRDFNRYILYFNFFGSIKFLARYGKTLKLDNRLFSRSSCHILRISVDCMFNFAPLC